MPNEWVFGIPRDPISSPSEIGNMEPKYPNRFVEVIIHPLLIIWGSVIGSLGLPKASSWVHPRSLTARLLDHLTTSKSHLLGYKENDYILKASNRKKQWPQVTIRKPIEREFGALSGHKLWEPPHGCFQKYGGKTQNGWFILVYDGLFRGKSYEKMDDLGGFLPLFLEIPTLKPQWNR